MPALEGSNQTDPVTKEVGGISQILSEALDAFSLALTVSGRSRQTIELYQRSIEPLIAFLGDQPISDISPGDLRAYLAHLGEQVNRVTVGIRWRSVRAFFNWLYHEGWLHESPVKRIQAPRTPRQFPYILSDAQVQALIWTAKAGSSSWRGYRDYTIVLTLLDCGLRVSELKGLTINDLDLAHGSLNVTGKGSRERAVYFGRRLARVLREWLARRTLSLSGDALFCSRKGYALNRHELTRIVSRLACAAGIAGVRCSAHTLRHTFATAFIRNGGDPFALQRLLGHSDISTTMVYVHMAGAALREAYAKASPVDRLLGS
jgi:site-specific recombinase XerD